MRHATAFLIVALAGCQPSRDDLVAEAAKNASEIVRRAPPKQTLKAFGGTVFGKDQGEWGGEVAFQDKNGGTYTLVADNSHGIFSMPCGVVALTGLAHLGTNRGAVYLLSQPPGSAVKAQLLMQLPGAPCDVKRQEDRITMRIPRQEGYACYALVGARTPELRRLECPKDQPEVCSDER